MRAALGLDSDGDGGAKDHTADTLIPRIQRWIELGSTIISVFWRAYDDFQAKQYEHFKVNHSFNFNDPETGAHTNSIEGSWRAVKATFTSAGRKKAHIPGNLARYMFYKACKKKNVDRTRSPLRIRPVVSH